MRSQTGPNTQVAPQLHSAKKTILIILTFDPALHRLRFHLARLGFSVALTALRFRRNIEWRLSERLHYFLVIIGVGVGVLLWSIFAAFN